MCHSIRHLERPSHPTLTGNLKNHHNWRSRQDLCKRSFLEFCILCGLLYCIDLCYCTYKLEVRSEPVETIEDVLVDCLLALYKPSLYSNSVLLLCVLCIYDGEWWSRRRR